MKAVKCSTKKCRSEPAVQLPSGDWLCNGCWERHCQQRSD